MTLFRSVAVVFASVMVLSSNSFAANILGNTAPTTQPDADTNAVEVGIKFRSSIAGQVRAIRFYRGNVNSAGYSVSLWSSSGTRLATKSVTAGSTGWREIVLDTPVNIQANTTYIASYFTSNGRYSYQTNRFANAVVNGNLTALSSSSSGGNGVYRYGSSSGFPTQTYQATNYYVDIDFVAAGATPTPTPNPTATPTPTPTPTATPTPTPPPSGSLKVPGPNAALFANNIYYTCVNNLYVSTTGNDANAGTQASPLRTIQRANDLLPNTASARAGYCVNVMNGNYSTADITLSKGGNVASKTGFVVYRAMSLQGAKLTATAFDIFKVQAPYIIIDGFELIGRRSGSGINSCFNGTGYNGLHHIITTNNYIHDMGESGIKHCWAEYFWMIHNRLDVNAYNTWESGHSTYQPIVIPNYTPTSYDNQWTPYHNVYAYNRFNGNFTNPAGGPHTDGNGLIYDDTQHQQSAPNVLYTPMALIMGNVTWGNGGAGIQVGPTSANADVFNNTAYNNYLDTVNTGTWRGEISASITQNINFRNNIAYAVPASSGIRTNNSPYLGGNPTGTNSWTYNLAFGASPVMYSPNTFSSPTNKSNTNPRLVNPAGGNFALCTGVDVPNASCTAASPAIGAGVVVPYWQEQTAGSVDMGACPAGIAACP